VFDLVDLPVAALAGAMVVETVVDLGAARRVGSRVAVVAVADGAVAVRIAVLLTRIGIVRAVVDDVGLAVSVQVDMERIVLVVLKRDIVKAALCALGVAAETEHIVIACPT